MRTAQVAAVIRNLEAQTGLEITIEQRPTEVVRVTRLSATN
jgi:hypothetical protein